MPSIAYALLFAAGGLVWRNGPDLPVPVGGHAAGVVSGRILVAGGTTWEEGKKRWLDDVWALDPQGAAWRRVGQLPDAVGDAVGIGVEDGLVLVGGSDGKAATARCRRIRPKGGGVAVESLPDLPERRVYAAGDRIGDVLYVVGGCTDPARLDTATATLYALDLGRTAGGWKALAPLPGRARCVHAAVACGGALYVFGGAYLNEKGGPENLADAYRYLPGPGRWERLTDMPCANRGLTAASDGKGRIALFGGYTASAAESEGKPDDFGFTRDAFFYEAGSARYAPAGSLPRATVGAVPVVVRRELYLIGGEPVKRQRGAWTWITAVPW